MEEDKKRKGSIVAGEEVKVNENENKEKIGVSDTIEIATINEKESDKILDENVNKDNINGIKDEDKKEIKEDKNAKKELKKNKDGKKKINKQLLAVVLIGIACIVFTIALIVIQINNLNEKYKLDEPTNVFESKDKKEDEDKKYVVGENDTLDFNDLEVERYYIIDGVEYEYSDTIGNDITSNYTNSLYIAQRIKGLKNKELENRINNEIVQKLKDYAKTDESGRRFAGSNLVGNFNDILSICIYINFERYQDAYGYNIDLNTGNEIAFEDVFTKSAPIASLLSNGFTKNLAWDFEVDVDYNSVSDSEYFQRRDYFLNMNNRDTSEYEDMGLEVANWYMENKGNIGFTISPFVINVYGVKTKDKKYNISIPLYDNNYCIAIYKRFKSQNSIYEKDLYGSGYIPFSMPMSYFSNCRIENQIEHGKALSNLYIDMCFSTYSSTDNEKVKNMAKTLAQNLIQEEKKKAMNNTSKCYTLQGEVILRDNTKYVEYYNEEIKGYFLPHYTVTIAYGDMELDNFDNLMNDLAKTALLPRASADSYTLKYYNEVYINKDYYKGEERKTYYFDKDGNYLGDDIMVVKDTSRDGYNPS